MYSEGSHDRMSAVPLMNLNERRTNATNSTNPDDWSDLEEFSRDPLESVLMQMRLWPQSITRHQCVRSAVYASAISVCVGFTVGYILFLLLYPPHYCMSTNKFDQSLTDKLKSEINSSYIKQFLKNFTSQPIQAGAATDKETADYIYSLWKKQGLTNVHLVPYNTLLNYPNEQIRNQIQISNSGKNLTSFQSDVNGSLDNFVAFSTSTAPVEGKIIYANYGQQKDYELLKTNITNIKGKIALCRIKTSNVQPLVRTAETYGISAIILFPDPEEFSSGGQTNVYPDGIFLPNSFVKSYSLDVHGDILTPYFPATDYAYRREISEAEKEIGRIPVQPISYEDAEQLITLLKPKQDNWYKTAFASQDDSSNVRITVNNHSKLTNIYNVIGIIKGREEPDRYIILGNHRDAFGLGSVNAHSGTAVLLELSRAFGKLVKKGWHPRRTLVFCSWSGGAEGHLGSTEWAEEHAKLLMDRAVAYLNIDAVVQGNTVLEAMSVPSLHGLLYDITKMVGNPNPEEIKLGRKTVYDTWIHKSHTNSLPRIFSPLMNGDYCNFIHVLGIPILELRYTDDTSLGYQQTFPLDSVYNESYHLVVNLLDKEFKYHIAMAQLYGFMALKLVDSPLFPFNITNYALKLKRIFMVVKNHSSIIEGLKSKNIALKENLQTSIENLQTSIENFINITKTFRELLKSVDMKDSLKIRSLNDQLMKVEKVFIENRGLSCLPEFKHIIFSRKEEMTQAEDSFPCLNELLNEVMMENTPSMKMKIWEKIKQEIASLTFYIRSATNTLKIEPL